MNSFIYQLQQAVIARSDLVAIFVHPERGAELIRELAEVEWFNEDTGACMKGLPSDANANEPPGVLCRVAGIPVVCDRSTSLMFSLRDANDKPVLFWTRCLQENGINLIQPWTADE